ncbi:hypothetical protein F4819DRAFT_467854 [Hypoxylon fuscum]|nr:hypothetical protein F4819DRAFT_467854 [Hypoxylon fuscum]
MMAEVLGIVASILSISKAIISGVNLASELYKAPEEIRTLHEQVQVFRCVLQAVQEIPRHSPNTALTSTLCRAEKIVEDLHQLLTIKLLRQGGKSDRTRRRAWLRNKSKIVMLRDNLRDARETLWVALSANSIVSTSHLESSLLAINQQAILAQSVLNRWRQNAGGIENTLEIQYLPQIGGMVQTLGTASRPNEETQDTMNTKKSIISVNGPERNPPAGSFESSSSFFPERYTAVEAATSIVGYMNYQEHATNYSRVNRYELFYCKAPREWIRLSISATVSVESPYWYAMRIPSSKCMMADLPTGLARALQTFLTSRPELEQGSHLSIYVGNQLGPDMDDRKLNLLMQISKPQLEIEEHLKTITTMTYHWNCPRYFEKEVIQQPMYKFVHDNRFIAYLQSRWVLVFRFGSDKAQLDSNLYILKVLHCLRRAPGVNPFIGTILDSRGLISGFMTELPLQGRLTALLIDACRSGNPIEWKRREKWCKQIVQAVATVHSQAFPIGTLTETLCGAVRINGWDNAILCHFQAQFEYDSTRLSIVPPEYRHLASTKGCISASTQTDIYQLGLLIWMIATNDIYVADSMLYNTLSCNTKSATECIESNVAPAQLPSPDERFPRYIHRIISNCFMEDPCNRPPAWKLLEMFPSEEDVYIALPNPGNDVTSESSPGETILCAATQETDGAECYNLSSWKEMRPSIIGKAPTRLEDCEEIEVKCNLCSKRTREHFFHCNVCILGSYDICPACFDQGAHCPDDEHYLRELFYSLEGEEIFYTSVKGSGCREIVKL